MTGNPDDPTPRVDLTKRNSTFTPPPSPLPLGDPLSKSQRGSGGILKRFRWWIAGGAVLLILGCAVAALSLFNEDEGTPELSTSSSADEDSASPTSAGDGEEQAALEPSGEPTEAVDAAADAGTELEEIAATNKASVAALQNVWTAQLASSAPGEPLETILDKYRELKSRYPGALLARSGDWPGSFGPSSRESWVVLSGDSYTTTGPLLDWCASEGFSDGQCWAKRLATSGDDPLVNTDRRPADARNN